MAAKEIKSISVPPSAEEATINQWQAFGWEFKSTQEVKTKSTHEEAGKWYEQEGTRYSVVTTEHYVKLTFERDPSMPNYAELCNLEKKYNAAPMSAPSMPTEPTEPKRWFRGCLIIIPILLMIMGVVGIAAFNDENVSLFLLYLGMGLMMQKIMYPIKHAKWKKKHAEWETRYASWKRIHDEYNNKPEIIKRAKELLQ
ncbi:MAG: hypothetical protein LBH25_01870 [Fibromonadaceae bacterium]|jgi:hypothetical protein|nr:hypothetical protein [Fibromonadaceae bacterium]